MFNFIDNVTTGKLVTIKKKIIKPTHLYKSELSPHHFPAVEDLSEYIAEHTHKQTHINTIIHLSLHNFFLSLLLLIRCILSLSQAFKNNTELTIFGRHRELNLGPLA